MAVRDQRGFTLIELLVVIAIVSVLAALILVSLASSQKGARDAARRSDLSQVGLALAHYASRHADRYPVRATEVSITDLTELAEEGFISTFPSPPNPAYDSYTYVSDGQAFGVCTRLEKPASDMLRQTASGQRTTPDAACTVAP